MTGDHDEYVADEETIEPVQPPKRLHIVPPVEWNNKTYESIVLREPTIGQIMEVRKVKDPMEQGLKLVQLNTGIPMQVALMLPQGILEAAGKYFEGFSPPSQENTES